MTRNPNRYKSNTTKLERLVIAQQELNVKTQRYLLEFLDIQYPYQFLSKKDIKKVNSYVLSILSQFRGLSTTQLKILLSHFFVSKELVDISLIYLCEKGLIKYNSNHKWQLTKHTEA